MLVTNYEIIGKATVESGGTHKQYTLKLLYRGDGTPWWVCSAGLALPVSEAFYNSVKVGQRIAITLTPEQAS